MSLWYRLEAVDKMEYEPQVFNRKAIDYGVCVIITTVLKRMDSTQKQLHKENWIQSAKRRRHD